jgi:hypothetical protein
MRNATLFEPVLLPFHLPIPLLPQVIAVAIDLSSRIGKDLPE